MLIFSVIVSLLARIFLFLGEFRREIVNNSIFRYDDVIINHKGAFLSVYLIGLASWIVRRMIVFLRQASIHILAMIRLHTRGLRIISPGAVCGKRVAFDGASV